MTAKLRRLPRRRPDMRKAVFLFPSGLTLLNLFFGVFAIIAASRLEFTTAGVYVVIGGICDALDGRVARATNAGSQFGEELDSLVDAITFGLAPGMIMYFAVLNRGGWDWVWVFAFAAAAVLRLARFNIEQAGTAKTYFQGLPSPAAGITLASFYWFSESWLYSYGQIAHLNWHVTLRFLMAGLAALMISNVPYPSFPRTGFRSVRAIASSVVVFGAFALLLTGRLEYFFPIAVLYVIFGLLRWMLSGLFERRQPTLPYDLSEGEDEDDDEYEDEDDDVAIADNRPLASRPAARASGGSRVDRGRARPARPERDEADATPPRGDRGARRADRPERGERPERSARPDRAERTSSERTTEIDRAARRDKKRDRPKRGDRPERPERSSRAEPSPTDDADSSADLLAPVTPVVPPHAGASEDRGRPEPVPTEDEEMFDDDESPGSEADGTTPAGTEGRGSSEGAPARKRKRRRRRGGERKERAPGDATAGEGAASSSSPASSSSSSDSDQSPYAAAPTAYSPPTPATVPVHFPSSAATPPAAPAFPASSSPAPTSHYPPASSAPVPPPTRSEPDE